jgi:hypothetical protein
MRFVHKIASEAKEQRESEAVYLAAGRAAVWEGTTTIWDIHTLENRPNRTSLRSASSESQRPASPDHAERRAFVVLGPSTATVQGRRGWREHPSR